MKKKKPDVLVVFVTAANPDEAQKLAQRLVEEKLAACVNIVPGLQSLYWWQGKIEKSAETLLIVKTLQSSWKVFSERVRQLHSYSVPEILAFPVVEGNPSYLDWVEHSLKGDR